MLACKTHRRPAVSAGVLVFQLSLWDIYLVEYNICKYTVMATFGAIAGHSVQFIEIYYSPGKLLLTMDLYNGRCRMWKGTRCIIDIDDYKEFLAIAKEMASELIKIGE